MNIYRNPKTVTAADHGAPRNSGKRIPQSVKDQIRRLLAEKVPYLRIEEITGVGKSQVGNIANELRGKPSPSRAKPKVRSGVGLFPSVRQGIATRCPTCRGLVYLPCRLCALRKLQKGVGV